MADAIVPTVQDRLTNPDGTATDLFYLWMDAVSSIVIPDSDSGLQAVVDDPTPYLGGDLNLNSSDVVGTGNIDITGNVNITGDISANTIASTDVSTGDISADTLTATSGASFGNLITAPSLNLGSSTAVSSVLDEDNMISDSSTALATQQSIKAYVDSQVGGGGGILSFISETIIGVPTVNVDIAIPTTGYKSLQFVMSDILPDTSGTILLLQVSEDGGSTYITTATYAMHAAFTASTFSGITTNTASGGLQLCNVVGNVANLDLISGFCDILDPGALNSRIMWRTFWRTNGTQLRSGFGGGYNTVITSPVTHYRFIFSLGNIVTGTWRLYGIS